MKYLLMSAAMLLLVTGCKPGNGKSREEVCETDMTRAGQKIRNDSEANIADSIRLYFTYPLPDGTEYRYTFLEFGAVGCAPCKKMEKEMETIRKDFEGKVNVRFINLSKKWNKDWAEYLEIHTIPTQVILDSQGKEIYRHVGYIPADELKKVFK